MDICFSWLQPVTTAHSQPGISAAAAAIWRDRTMCPKPGRCDNKTEAEAFERPHVNRYGLIGNHTPPGAARVTS